ncbi:MAG: hypothetical protein HFG37_04570 [Eubacterium sp.]|nr:hypothetical protein [Eubacterium sp.]
MKRIHWIDVGIRAGKTFMQAFVANISMEQIFAITDTESAEMILRSMLIAGLSAGISAVWNMVTDYLSQKKKVVW